MGVEGNQRIWREPTWTWPEFTFTWGRSIHKLTGSLHVLFIVITYSHLMILTHLPVSPMSISPPLIVHCLLILHGDAWSITHASPLQQELVMKKMISIYWTLLIYFSLFHQNHPFTRPALFSGTDQSAALTLSCFTLKVNFNHVQALSRAAATSIPLGDGVTAYRITLLFIKGPVTHYSLCSSWSH